VPDGLVDKKSDGTGLWWISGTFPRGNPQLGKSERDIFWVQLKQIQVARTITHAREFT